jgi:ABC-type lipoprotein release transport system permease subunit
MYSLALKSLLRTGGTASSIVAIALLVAILSSAQSITNHINFQTEMLGKLVYAGGPYLILSGNSTSIADSRVDAGLASKLSGLSCVRWAVPQKVFEAELETSAGSRTINVRCLDDVRGFLGRMGSYINGTTPGSWVEADVGEVLARAYNVNLGDELELGVGGKHAKLKIVGVFRSQTNSDAELLASMETARMLTGENGTVSLVEIVLQQGVDSREALSQIERLLPENVRLVQTQQLKEFTQQMNMQTLAFLNVWSFAVYAVVAAASYIISTRLLTESSYEFSMLRALGAERRLTITLILAYTLTVSLTGSVLGVALGTAGSQTASTMLRWFLPSVELAPFVELWQAFQTITLTVAWSILGCMYPALRYTHVRYMEQAL